MKLSASKASMQASSALAVERSWLTNTLASKVMQPLRSASLHCIVSHKCCYANSRPTLSQDWVANSDSLAGWSAKDAFYLIGYLFQCIEYHRTKKVRPFIFRSVLSINRPKTHLYRLQIHRHIERTVCKRHENEFILGLFRDFSVT
jgi:hypothetical protein